jgi:serine/threonine protein phosphatase 1
MNNTYVIGDVHGEYEKLKKALKLVNFDFENDTLISLGDIVDRGPDSYACIELLMTIKNLIAIRGNHDYEWYNYINTRNPGFMWNQGQIETNQSYIVKNIDPVVHINFFEKQINYYIDDNNNLFVHGGFNRHYDITDKIFNSQDVFLWDRDLLASARSYSSMKNNEYPFKMKNNFNEVFVGHTPVQYFGHSVPQKYANVWCLDTGAGKFKDGTITIMNLKTKKYKQI